MEIDGVWQDDYCGWSRDENDKWLEMVRSGEFYGMANYFKERGIPFKKAFSKQFSCVTMENFMSYRACKEIEKVYGEEI